MANEEAPCVAKEGIVGKGDASGAVIIVGTTGVKRILDSTLTRYTSLTIKRKAEPETAESESVTHRNRMACAIGKIGAETEVPIGVSAVSPIAHDTRKVTDKKTETGETHSARKSGGKSGSTDNGHKKERKEGEKQSGKERIKTESSGSDIERQRTRRRVGGQERIVLP